MLYRGVVVNNIPRGFGLLEACGLASEKHAGQLKRIAAPCIGLLRWLITYADYGNDNIFYDRFVVLTEADYQLVNLAKHINQDSKVHNSARLGSSADAFFILSIILRDHRLPDTGEQDPLSISSLLPDKVAKEKFTAWYNKATAQQVRTTLGLSL